ncbi:MAG: KaiC domain-containing protein [Candidatus Methanomethylicota archaeon]|uniref:KaiC domain-containing protein n=1 Tax=Thermoproteota archaeon TaxID=2056631 RepID=A0A497F1U4_9CREN|nr:MAG: KaiC domain-containing protein [Candidatus Verstraetearchaeota archaeon]RLE52860.1 MAG: KaiC domain-containing protein [Candidatus Verstraetearchaeota archaeon]
MERLSTGVAGLDAMLEGGIPRGFLVAVTGEPGTGKTILCIHFIAKGIDEGDRCIFITTEESRESIFNQASQFGFDFRVAVSDRRLVLIDALMGYDDPWSLKNLEVEELVSKIIEAKKHLGYGRARLVIDSMSAFWLDKPAMARRYSYFIKKVLAKWDFTILATSQYAISTSEAFGWGIEHVADGIIRFRRAIRNGVLKRFVIIEKMRQTQHSLKMHEIDILPDKGLVVVKPTEQRKEDVSLPSEVLRKIKRSQLKAESEIP